MTTETVFFNNEMNAQLKSFLIEHNFHTIEINKL